MANKSKKGRVMIFVYFILIVYYVIFSFFFLSFWISGRYPDAFVELYSNGFPEKYWEQKTFVIQESERSQTHRGAGKRSIKAQKRRNYTSRLIGYIEGDNTQHVIMLDVGEYGKLDIKDDKLQVKRNKLTGRILPQGLKDRSWFVVWTALSFIILSIFLYFKIKQFMEW